MKNFRHQHQRPKKNTLVIGREAILKAFAEGRQLDRIYMQATIHGEVIDKIKQQAAEFLVPINKVPVEKLNNFNVSNHEGCIAQISKIQYQDLQQVVSLVVENGEVPLLIILDGITDIRNIGAIARSAFSMGVHAIIIPDRGIGSLNEDAILTSAGALENIAVCRVNSLMKAVDTLHLNGIKVFAADMKASTKLYDCNFTEPTAIILGGEEHGIYPALMKAADLQFHIPMPGQFESLNVSVAAGISLYEVVRQRGKG